MESLDRAVALLCECLAIGIEPEERWEAGSAVPPEEIVVLLAFDPRGQVEKRNNLASELLKSP